MAKKVLIVEDEKPMARALELKLKKEGLDAQAVFNGEQALEILEKDAIDLVLLDLIMPKMDGFALMEEIKNKGIKTKILVTSNLSQVSDYKKAEDLGAAGFFVKSDTSIIEVVKKVKENLGI